MEGNARTNASTHTNRQTHKPTHTLHTTTHTHTHKVRAHSHTMTYVTYTQMCKRTPHSIRHHSSLHAQLVELPAVWTQASYDHFSLLLSTGQRTREEKKGRHTRRHSNSRLMERTRDCLNCTNQVSHVIRHSDGRKSYWRRHREEGDCLAPSTQIKLK